MAEQHESEAIAAARRALGRELAALRQEAGYSQEAFAPLTGYGRSTLANVETGRQNAARGFWVRCEEQLGTGTLIAAYDEIQAMVAARWRSVSRRAEAEREERVRAWRETHAGEGEDRDVRRREFLVLTGAAATALDTMRNRSASHRAGTPGTLRSPGRVDAETCEGLASLMLGYRQVYRSASASSLLGPVCGTMNLLTELAGDSGPHEDTVVSLIGQAAVLAGAILMFDLGDFTNAKHCLATGSKAAHQSSDSELMTITLACRAFHATYSGDIRGGVAFAQGALDVAASGIHPRSHAWAAAVASEMYASLGPAGEAPCMAALETATRQLARPMPERPWAGIGAFDHGKLAAYRGGDLMRLGRYTDAQAQLQLALDQLGPALVKHRCTAHIDLAEAYAHDDEPDRAAWHALHALDIIASTSHADSFRRVENVHAAVTTAGASQARELGARILELRAAS